MKLEEIKTENDAREALVESILTIYQHYLKSMVGRSEWASGDLQTEAKLYNLLKEHLKHRFNIDTSPYDNVARKYAPNI